VEENRDWMINTLLGDVAYMAQEKLNELAKANAK
jgi:hypothetical protein